jgi:hypothetical protein
VPPMINLQQMRMITRADGQQVSRPRRPGITRERLANILQDALDLVEDNFEDLEDTMDSDGSTESSTSRR